MNEETIAGIVGWGKTLGSIASSITVELHAPGQVRRAAGKSGAGHTVFRVGEVHGRVTERAKQVCRLVGYADSAVLTDIVTRVERGELRPDPKHITDLRLN